MFRRILALLVIASVGALSVVYVNFPDLRIGETAEPLTVDVSAKQPELICPGPVLVNGGASGVTLGKFTPSGSAAIQSYDGGQASALVATAMQSILGKTSGSRNFNAIQSQSANLSQAFGLSAANCEAGSNEAWLVAGDNSIGREALLVLANPGKVDATVSLDIIGPSGLVEGTGLSGISVPAKQSTSLPIASFAPKTATFAIKISVRGSLLGIWLQQKTVRGLTPGGLDLVGQLGEPAKVVDIPGFYLRNSAKLESLAASDENLADLRPMLRVVAPGDKPANFIAQVQGADGTNFGTVIQGTVPAGTTKDFELTDLSDGNYSIHLESDEPILAAARFSRVSGSNQDFAWAVAVSPTKLKAGFSTVGNAISKLSIVNSNDKPAKVQISGQTYSIPANSNSSITLSGGRAYFISSDIEVSVSQVIDISGGVAVVPVLDYASVGGKLKVSVR
jgi:hypothetical protein